MKNNPVRLTWRCKECKDVVVSHSKERHQMDYCKCGKTAVDLEEYYARHQGSPEVISREELINGKWIRKELDA